MPKQYKSHLSDNIHLWKIIAVAKQSNMSMSYCIFFFPRCTKKKKKPKKENCIASTVIPQLVSDVCGTVSSFPKPLNGKIRPEQKHFCSSVNWNLVNFTFSKTQLIFCNDFIWKYLFQMTMLIGTIYHFYYSYCSVIYFKNDRKKKKKRRPLTD